MKLPRLDPGQKSDEELTGLGGWLILLGIYLVNSLAGFLRHAQEMAEAFEAPNISELTKLGSAKYDSAWMALRVVETVGNAMAGIGVVGLMVLFFLKHRCFRTLFVVHGCFVFALVFTKLCLAKFGPSLSGVFTAGHTEATVGAFAATALWMGYVLQSRRVELTFTRRFYRSPFPPFFTVS